VARSGETTIPVGPGTGQAAGVADCLALVEVWNDSQPQRLGWVAFFPFGEPLLVGRGGAGTGKLALFAPQRPGETFAVDPREGPLRGGKISREQLLLQSSGVALEMEQVGGCPTYVNGELRKRATLQPGDTVLLEQGALLLCVRRAMALAGPPERALHPFGEPDLVGIVGESPAIWLLRQQIAFAAGTLHHVLIQGETGAGKELTAAAVHLLSRRAKGRFVARNASTFAAGLVASELFGNPANYPNPGPARKGLVGEADGGTLFLDEIGDCPKDVQVQLLRVMDHGEYQAVGESTVRRADLRVIGATHRDDDFGRDDFLRRFLVRVRVPPVRERREDVPLLIRHHLLSEAKEMPQIERFLREGPDGRLEPRISARLVDHLVRHPLSGNTRELHAVLVRAIEASGGDKLTLAPADARSTGRSLLPPPATPRGPVALGPAPKEEVVACLERTRGNISHAAKALGMSRNALHRLMRKYGIERKPSE